MVIAQVFHRMNMGGAETFIVNVMKNMPKEDIEFVFVVHSELPGFYDDLIKSFGYTIHVAPKCNSWSKNEYRKWWKNFVLNRHIDIVHCHPNYPLRDIIKALSNTETKVIAHSHSSSAQGNSKSFKVRLKNLVVKTRQKYIRKNTDGMLACSDKAGKFAFGYDANYKIITNGIATKDYMFNHELREKSRIELKLKDKKAIGIVARLTEAKNHDFFIRLIEYMAMQDDSIIGVVVGDGELAGYISNRIEKSDYKNNFLLTGAIIDVNSVYNALDVFVLPSHYEGLPLSLVEAQCCGLPCVVTSRITRDVDLTKYITFVDSDEFSKWSESIYIAMEIERSTGAADIAKSGFDISKTIADLNDVYNTVVNNE